MKKGKTKRKSKDKSKGMLLNDSEMSEFLLGLAADVIAERKAVAEKLKETIDAQVGLRPQDTVSHAIAFLTRDITPQQYLDEVNAKLDREEQEK